ncbi:MAG: hypothetical protein K0R58_4144 [Ramlibacter sp.]|jgi:hypothetical protein|nr:hypothetical protein [Ramlibacter sp.]
MIPAKTPAGQQVLKDRSVNLTPRQRAAFILIDGKRSVEDVLSATQAAGVTREDIERLFQLGVVAAGGTQQVVPSANDETPKNITPQERYAAAYPVATKLTAGLGLRGLRLNLAVESAGSYEDLRALAPKILDAVGAEKFAELDAALRGR